MNRRAGGWLMLACIAVCAVGLVWAEDETTPPGPPGSSAARMKSLNQIEPRTVIMAIPYKITNAGSFYLGASLSGVANSNGIEIAANDVRLDLGGFGLNGVQDSWHGVAVTVPCDNVTIRNGVIRGWGMHAIVAGSSPGVAVGDLKVFGNGWGGIYAGDNALVERCQIYGNGMHAPTNDPPQDDAIQVGAYSTVVDCKVRANRGAGIHVKSHGRITGCTSTGSQQAEGIHAENYSIVRDCVCASNKVHGIRARSNCRVEDNICGQNGVGGSPFGGGVLVEGNNTLVDGNTVNANQWGIGIPSPGSGNLVVRNSASGNKGTDYFVEWGNSNYLGTVTMPQGGQFSNSNPWANFRF